MKEYIEPEVEIIEYLLGDIIAKSVETSETSGYNQDQDIISSTASDNNENEFGDDDNNLDNLFNP